MSRRPSWLVRLLRRSPSRPAAAIAPPADPVPPGRRREEWLLIAGTERNERTEGLARSLAREGHATTLVSRGSSPGEPDPNLELVDALDLSRLRSHFSGRVDRVRVVVSSAEAETIALARDLSAYGARIAYDAPPREGPLPGPLSYDAQTERALLDTVDDLVAEDGKVARQISAVAGGTRIVHVVPSLAGEESTEAVAAALQRLSARPLVMVLLATGPERSETLDAVEAFHGAAEDGAYRLAVVASAADPASDELDEREERGDLTLLRSARPGRWAAWNLGLSATRSEIVVFADPMVRPTAVGWLAPALNSLAGGRELAAVGLRGRDVPGATRRGMDVAALDARGLVAMRAALRRVEGFDVSLGSTALCDVDLSFRFRDLGLRLGWCPELGLKRTSPEGDHEDLSAEAGELRRRWAHRPGYLEEG